MRCAAAMTALPLLRLIIIIIVVVVVVILYALIPKVNFYIQTQYRFRIQEKKGCML